MVYLSLYNPSIKDKKIIARNEIKSRKYNNLIWKYHNNEYINVMTGYFCTIKPKDYIYKSYDHHIYNTIQDIPLDLINLSHKYNINIKILEINDEIYDSYYQDHIKATPALLKNLLFYQYILLRELSIYPINFINNISLSTIYLVENLKWKNQNVMLYLVIKVKHYILI